VHVNGSDLCALRTVGVNLSTHIRIALRRSKANINRLFGNTSTAHESACRFPYEIVEMIIAHVAHTARDLDALKACSLTCRSWYAAAVPYLHDTLILRNDVLGTTHGGLKPLSELDRLGLSPLVKGIRVVQMWTWFVPQAFSPRDLRYLSTFANVHILGLEYLDISLFIPGTERYFGHFSPTLRSITLVKPFCTPRQLSHFLSLFPNLDNIMIWQTPTSPPNTITLDTELVPFSTPRLRGRLVLYYLDSIETCTHLIASGGGLRFRHMDLCRTGGCAPVLLEACAGTLETLRFYVADASVGE
jgi:hypothetical protein